MLGNVPSNMKLLAEPGRFFSAPCISSISTVMGKAHRNEKTWYYLDDGVYGSFNGILNDHTNYPLFTPYNNGEEVPSALAGPTCDSVDMVSEEILLPELEEGDIIVAEKIGAYSWACASTFNFYPKTNIVVLDSENVNI